MLRTVKSPFRSKKALRGNRHLRAFFVTQLHKNSFGSCLGESTAIAVGKTVEKSDFMGKPVENLQKSVEKPGKICGEHGEKSGKNCGNSVEFVGKSGNFVKIVNFLFPFPHFI